MKTSFSIGEFSQITGLSVKTLRFYHEKGILVPTSVDEASGYRFYDASKIEKARVIMRLRQMEFSIEDIATIFRECDDDANVLEHLQRQKSFLQQRMREDRDIVRALSDIIAKENEARRLLEAGGFAVEEKSLEPILVAGIRMKGKYSDCGAGFARLGKAIGRYISGKCLCLYYDCEYREEDADFEPCFPVRKRIEVEGIFDSRIARRPLSVAPSPRPLRPIRPQLRQNSETRERPQNQNNPPHPRNLHQRPGDDLPRQSQKLPDRNSIAHQPVSAAPSRGLKS